MTRDCPRPYVFSTHSFSSSCTRLASTDSDWLLATVVVASKAFVLVLLLLPLCVVRLIPNGVPNASFGGALVLAVVVVVVVVVVGEKNMSRRRRRRRPYFCSRAARGAPPKTFKKVVCVRPFERRRRRRRRSVHKSFFVWLLSYYYLGGGVKLRPIKRKSCIIDTTSTSQPKNHEERV